MGDGRTATHNFIAYINRSSYALAARGDGVV